MSSNSTCKSLSDLLSTGTSSLFDVIAAGYTAEEIAFVSEWDRAPVIKCEGDVVIRGKKKASAYLCIPTPILALFDTGASRVCINANLVERLSLGTLPIHPVTLSLAQKGTETKIAITRGVVLNVSLSANRICRVVALVVPNLSKDLILGMDFLINERLMIDPISRSLIPVNTDDQDLSPIPLVNLTQTFRDKDLDFLEPECHFAEPSSYETLLRVCEDTHVPPGTHFPLHASVASYALADFAGKDSELHCVDVFSSSTLTLTNNGVVMPDAKTGVTKVCVLNCARHSLFLPKGQVIATINTVLQSNVIDTEFEFGPKGLDLRPDIHIDAPRGDRESSVFGQNSKAYAKSKTHFPSTRILPDVLDECTYGVSTPDEQVQCDDILKLIPEIGHANLTEEQRAEIKAVATKHWRQFQMKIHISDDVSLLPPFPMSIPTNPDASPTHEAPRRQSPPEKLVCKENVEEMAKMNVIRRSTSPWAHPVVIVKKPDGGWRFCIDYRKTNAITPADRFPLPRIDNVLDALEGASIFSTFDLTCGYWQVPVKEEDKKKTAFLVPDGLWEFNTVPFGLTQAPAHFQRMMDMILAGFKWTFCLVYLDDIVIFSKTVGEHCKHLDLVLDILGKHHLVLKPTKCHIAVEKIKLLGHMVSKEGVQPNPKTVSAIHAFPVPKEEKGVRAFLGIAGYYRKFIKNFATVARPLTKLLAKGADFEWTEEQVTSMGALQSALTSDSIMAFPDMTRPFIVAPDASNYGIGATLTQIRPDASGKDREYVIAYASRTLTPAEVNYHVTEREGLALVWSVWQWRHYLHGSHFTVTSNHGALEYIKTSNPNKGRVARWSLMLQDFDFTVKHIPGRLNSAPDGLSRGPIPLDPEEDTKSTPLDIAYIGTLTPVDDDLTSVSEQVDMRDVFCYAAEALEVTEPEGFQVARQSWIAAQQQDVQAKAMSAYLKDHVQPSTTALQSWCRKTASNYILEADGMLSYVRYRAPQTVPSGPRPGVYVTPFVPVVLRAKVLLTAHEGLGGAHGGVTRTIRRLETLGFWPGCTSDAHTFVTSCAKCQIWKQTAPSGTPPVDPIIAIDPMELVEMDTMFVSRTSLHGNRCISVFTDHCTRWVEAEPTPNKPTDVELAHIFVKDVVCRHGCPRVVMSDQGGEFVNRVMDEVCKILHIDRHISAAYHPKSHGQVENFNKQIRDGLATTCATWDDWDEVLPLVLFAMRINVGGSTKESPFFLMYGRDPLLPDDIHVRPPFTERTFNTQTYAEKMQTRLTDAFIRVRANLDMARQRMRDQDAAVRKGSPVQVDFAVGDYVKMMYPERTDKSLPRYIGPYRVTQKVSSTLYKITPTSVLSKWRIHPYAPSFPIHILRLRKWHVSDVFQPLDKTLLTLPTPQRSSKSRKSSTKSAIPSRRQPHPHPFPPYPMPPASVHIITPSSIQTNCSEQTLFPSSDHNPFPYPSDPVSPESYPNMHMSKRVQHVNEYVYAMVGAGLKQDLKDVHRTISDTTSQDSACTV